MSGILSCSVHSPGNWALRRKGAVLLLATLLAGFGLGCGSGNDGPARRPVVGRVTVGDQPVRSASIRFVPIRAAPGPIATGPVTEGEYALSTEEGPIPGSYRVEIVGFDLGFDLGDQAVAEEYARTHGNKPPANPIPPGYGTQSPLTAEVTPEGEQRFDFQLDAQGPPKNSLPCSRN